MRDVAYQSRTTDFWNSLDGLGGQSTYELGGSFNDGKGEPGQSNAVSHGCPPARFRKSTYQHRGKDHVVIETERSKCYSPKMRRAQFVKSC